MESTNTANIWVAIGTILLALAAFANIWLSRKQARIFTRQLILQRSQLIPNLRIKNIEFKENIAKVNIENFSGVPGYEVGLSSSFHLVNPEYYASPDRGEKLSSSRVQQMIAEKKQLYLDFQPIQKEDLVYQGKRIVPQEYVTFMITNLNEATLLPQQSAYVEVEPNFYIGTKDILPHGQIMNFEKMKEVLLQNNYTYAAIIIELVYKDKLETPMGFEPYAKFIINFKRHKTLEEAWREGVSFSFMALSQGEIQRKLKGVTMDHYKNAKSSKSPEILEKMNKEYF